jgi:ClpP class serine protease
MFNATEMFHKIKVNWDTVNKGEHCRLGSLSRPWTDEEKHIITRSIDIVTMILLRKWMKDAPL